MFEKKDVSIRRRILGLLLWFVIIVAVIGALVWFIFFRHTAKSSTHRPTSSTSQSQTTTNNQSSSTTNQNAANSTTSSTNTTTDSTTTGTLANTGPGDIFTPVIIATIIGSTCFYIRLHRQYRKTQYQTD